MPQRSYGYGGYYTDPNAELIAKLIEQLGENAATAIARGRAERVKEQEYRISTGDELNRFKDLFAKMDPKDRESVLSEPTVLDKIRQMVDPHLFTKHNVKKEGPMMSDEVIRQMMLSESPKAKAERETAEFAKTEASAKVKSAEQEALSKTEKNLAYSKFLKAQRDYKEGKIDVYDLQAAAVAYDPTFAQTQNFETISNPELVQKAHKAKTPGTPEWFELETKKKLESLVSEYQITKPEQIDTLRQFVAHLEDKNAPLPDMKGMPESWKSLEDKARTRQIRVAEGNLAESRTTHKFEMTKTLAAAGITDAEKQRRFVEYFEKNGAPPPDMPLPLEKRTELLNQLTAQQTDEAQQQIRLLKDKDTMFDQLVETSRAKAAAGDKSGAEAWAKKAGEYFMSKHPELQDKPGFKIMDLIRGAFNLGGSAAAGVGAVASDALTPGPGDASTMVPPVVKRVAGAVGPVVQQGVAGGFEAAGNIINKAGEIEGKLYPMSEGSRLGRAHFGDPFLGISSFIADPDSFIKSWKENYKGLQQLNPFQPIQSPEGGMLEGKPEALLQLRDQHLDRLQQVLDNPMVTDEDRQHVRLLALAFQKAGDDPARLFTVFNLLGGANG